ncbi:MAG: hypothetical protein A4E65_01748 [Syntrophorhabdus sp. PtaU1.Bin153]|nr:MAG: hypothetical protein A4E65_01748 [Syntrophorhabdus sp. PtaU1.Bin153]
MAGNPRKNPSEEKQKVRKEVVVQRFCEFEVFNVTAKMRQKWEFCRKSRD